jgi:predicted amidohydrolase YtcJ
MGRVAGNAILFLLNQTHFEEYDMRLLINVNIQALARKNRGPGAILVDKNKILAIGQESDFSTLGDNHIKEDLSGSFVLPGLTDAHIHLKHYSLSLDKLNCEVETLNECLRRIRHRVLETPKGKWILGHGWNQNEWADGFGTAQDLDEIAPHNPVYLTAKSLHAGWANTAALQAAGIHNNSPNPSDGILQRDQHGNLTGILFEGAMQLVYNAVPAPNISELATAIDRAQRNLWQMGVTSVHDFDQRDCFSALQTLRDSGNLNLRVLKSLPIKDLEHAIALGLRSGFGDDMLRIGSLKAFADGALGPHTAAMLAPYKNDPTNQGMLLIDAEEMFELGQKAVKNGLSLAVHAIGDRANHEMLNAFEQIRKYESSLDLPTDLRHRIEHVQLLHPDDIARLAKLDIIASMQPIHAISDMKMADDYWGSRSRYAYAWRSQIDNGARLAFGSDAPVESPNPFWGLAAAISRKRAGDTVEKGWVPEQCLTLQEALSAYTSSPAYAAGMENRLGKLTPGFLADLIFLDKDPFKCNLETLRDLKPVAVMVDGKWVLKENKF